MKTKLTAKKTPPATVVSLAQQLGVSRQLIIGHYRKSGTPPLDDVEAWQAYLAAFGREGSTPAGLRKNIASARLRVIKAIAHEKERANRIADAKLVDKEEVSEYLVKAFALLFTRLDKRSDELPSIIQGLSAGDVKAKLLASNEDLKAELRSGFEKMFARPEPQR